MPDAKSSRGFATYLTINDRVYYDAIFRATILLSG